MRWQNNLFIYAVKLLTAMKLQTPAANIVIGSLYFIIIIAIGYVVKLTIRPKSCKQSPKAVKFTTSNMGKGLRSPTIQRSTQPIPVVLKSFGLKYSVIGCFWNHNKCYLLKQMFIMSIIAVTCCAINVITLWPIALCITFFVIAFVTMEIIQLPSILSSNPKVGQQQKIGHVNVGQDQVELEPGLIVGQNRHSNNQIKSDQQKQKSGNNNKINISYKYMMFVGVLAFVTLILASQTMFTIYNSISNLGALNIGSVAIILLIDQLACRPFIAGLLLITTKLIMYSLQNNQNSYLQNGMNVKSDQKLKLFDFRLFKNLCEQQILQQMNKIYLQNGDQQDYEMGASPTRKKTLSPSKVPKANPLVIQSDTLMNLEQTKRIQEQEQKVQQIEHISQKEQNIQIQVLKKSPIKQIEQSLIQDSILFTSAEKHMFGQELQNNQLGINKSVQIGYNTEKIKVNPNQYFSVQRLPKQELNADFGMDDDGLVLVEAGLNMIKEKQNKQKPSTIDIDFSPTKKRKKVAPFNHKKRQLIITGSSPYLEYLPDMMKKDKHLKKNLTPSQPQIPTVSRKVL